MEKLEGKKPFGRPGYRWEDDNKWILKKKDGRTGTGLIWLRTGTCNGDLLNVVMRL